jgi:hypothetical protein
MAIDVSKIQGLSNAAKEAQENAGSGPRTDLPIGYLPQGSHYGRLIMHPDSEAVYYKARVHRDKADKAVFKCTGSDDSCPICDYANALPFEKGYQAKTQTLAYFYLTKTNCPGEYWKEGTLYQVVANSFLAKGIDALFTSLGAASPETLAAALDPTKAGSQVLMNVIGGAQGSVTIMPIPGMDCSIPEEQLKLMKPIEQQTYLPKDFDEPAIEKFVAKLAGEYNAQEARNANAPAMAGLGEMGNAASPQPNANPVQNPIQTPNVNVAMTPPAAPGMNPMGAPGMTPPGMPGSVPGIPGIPGMTPPPGFTPMS